MKKGDVVHLRVETRARGGANMKTDERRNLSPEEAVDYLEHKYCGVRKKKLDPFTVAGLEMEEMIRQANEREQ